MVWSMVEIHEKELEGELCKITPFQAVKYRVGRNNGEISTLDVRGVFWLTKLTIVPDQ